MMFENPDFCRGHPRDGRDEVLRGRGGECRTLTRLLQAVRAGESRALIVRGEPGVGKTVLLDRVIEQASGCALVQAVGI
jgi:Cdc6-like AAA superfamily ATPase